MAIVHTSWTRTPEADAKHASSEVLHSLCIMFSNWNVVDVSIPLSVAMTCEVSGLAH